MKRTMTVILAAILVAGAQTTDKSEREPKAAKNAELAAANQKAAHSATAEPPAPPKTRIEVVTDRMHGSTFPIPTAGSRINRVPKRERGSPSRTRTRG